MIPGELPHWTQVVEDDEGQWWAECRCGWYQGSFRYHTGAAGYSRQHRESTQHENDAYVAEHPRTPR